MNAPLPPQKKIEFIDLKAQYAALRDEIAVRMQAVLDHGQYIMGPEVKELEAALAAHTGAKHCVTVASGTEALLIAMMALDLKSGDEVVTTPFTFAATAETIVLLGGVPVWVDIEPDTCNIDASKIEAAITPRTRAIMPVSLYGQCADMDEINAIAARHGLPVIEDAAQSFGATYRGRRSNNLSTFGCTSFFPSKPLGCYGDGGALFTNDDVLAQAAREIRVHGQSARYTHTRVGVGGRMDTLQCAAYHRRLAALNLATLTVRPDRDSVWGQYTVRVSDRARVQSVLTEAGVPTAVHYPRPLHRQPAYVKFGDPDSCPQALAAADEVMSLPMSADLTDADLDRVVAALTAAVGMRAQ